MFHVFEAFYRLAFGFVYLEKLLNVFQKVSKQEQWYLFLNEQKVSRVSLRLWWIKEQLRWGRGGCLLLRYHCGFAGEVQENKSFLYLNKCSHVISTINMYTALPLEKNCRINDFEVSIYSSRPQDLTTMPTPP